MTGTMTYFKCHYETNDNAGVAPSRVKNSFWSTLD